MSELFRKKSMERVNSPEQLNDYIRVSNPGVWMVLAAIIVLLLGVCVWGIFGHLDTTVDAVGVCVDGSVTCYIQEADISGIEAGDLVSINGSEYPLAEVAAFSVRFDAAAGASLLPAGTMAGETMVYTAAASAPDLADGSYAVTVIARRETPMSFVLN